MLAKRWERIRFYLRKKSLFTPTCSKRMQKEGKGDGKMYINVQCVCRVVSNGALRRWRRISVLINWCRRVFEYEIFIPLKIVCIIDNHYETLTYWNREAVNEIDQFCQFVTSLFIVGKIWFFFRDENFSNWIKVFEASSLNWIEYEIIKFLSFFWKQPRLSCEKWVSLRHSNYFHPNNSIK